MIRFYSQSKWLFLLALILLLPACTTDQEIIRFESAGNTLVFTKRDISGISLGNDTAGKMYANLTLSDRGQQLLSTFTSNNLNSTLTIKSNNHVLMKDIPIKDKITMKSIPFVLKSDQETKDFVENIKNWL